MDQEYEYKDYKEKREHEAFLEIHRAIVNLPHRVGIHFTDEEVDLLQDMLASYNAMFLEAARMCDKGSHQRFKPTED